MKYICILLLIGNITTITYILKKEKENKKEREKFEQEKEAEISRKADQIVNEHLEASKKNLESALQATYAQKKAQLDKQYEDDLAAYEKTKQSTVEAIKAQEQRLEDMKESENKIAQEYKDKMSVEISTTLDQKKLDEFDRIASEIQAYMNDAAEQKKLAKEEVERIMAELDDYKAKRDAINEEILRSRAIEEKEDFYRVNLDEASIHDLFILNEIKAQLSKVDFLNKLLYDNYVSKPAQEMVKRVLEGKSPSGIYKITRLKTGEVYVGKSTNVKDRWIQHCKSCYHCGTISHSTLHTTMEKDGINNFSWELIEEVPKERLSEREKYWIDFYDTKKYGLNERNG